jgi:hypothetical protein
MGDEFTPEELQLLIASGELTEADIPYLSTRDRLTAGKMLFDAGKMDVKGNMPLPGAGMLSGAMGAVRGAASKLPAPSLPSGIGSLAAQMGIDAIGQKLGIPWWITGPISHKVGRMGGGGGKAPAPSPSTIPSKAPNSLQGPPSPPPPKLGQASTPRADPPNLQRQGNLTNPGPAGPGSPSTPSGKVPNPLEPATSRQSPLTSFDEADKKKVMFGGVGGTREGKYLKPAERKGLTSQQIQQLIDQIMGIK